MEKQRTKLLGGVMIALKTKLAAILVSLALVAVLASPASAQTINVNPTVGVGDVDVAHDIANNITVQCAADPLIQSGTLVLNEDQCADDGGTNEDGGLF